MSDNRAFDNRYLYLILAGLGLLIYSSSLNGPFVFDDKAYISGNDWIKSLSNFKNISGMRYVGDLTFALNYKLNGLNTFGYHLVNVIIHIFNSFLVLHFARLILETPFFKTAGKKIENPSAFAFAAALFFLAHPVQVQAVTYISQRYTSLAAFFYLLSVVFFFKSRLIDTGSRQGPKLLYYSAAVIAAILGMKTKEICFTLPFTIALLDLCLFPDRFALRRLLPVIPFFLAAMIVPLGLVLPELGLSGSGNRMEELMRSNKLAEAMEISRYDYLITQATVVITYLRLMVFPFDWGLSYFHPLYTSVLEPRVLVSIIAVLASILAIFIILVRSARSRSVFGMIFGLGCAWYFITLSVESSVVPIKDVFNERRLYLPSIGAAVAFGALLFYLKEITGNWTLRRAELTATLILLAVAIPFSVSTYQRNALWSDSLSIYREEVRKTPYSSGPRMYLGIEYYERGMMEDALAEFREAARINPGSPYIRKTISRFFYNNGLIEESITELKKLIELAPDDLEAHNNLGALYLRKGMLDEAESELKEALRISPGHEDIMKALRHIHGLKAASGKGA